MAKILGISSAYVSYIKRGQRRISPAIMQKVCSAFPPLSYNIPEKCNNLPSFGTYKKEMNKTNESNLELLLQDFLQAKQVEGKSAVTLNFYRQNLERFLWWLRENQASLSTRDLNSHCLRSFLAYVQTTPNRMAGWLCFVVSYSINGDRGRLLALLAGAVFLVGCRRHHRNPR